MQEDLKFEVSISGKSAGKAVGDSGCPTCGGSGSYYMVEGVPSSPCCYQTMLDRLPVKGVAPKDTIKYVTKEG